MQAQSLFDTAPEDSHREFIQAFDAWVADPKIRGEVEHHTTRTLYRVIWQALAKWAVVQSPVVTVDNLSPDDLALYLDGRSARDEPSADISARHAWRLLNVTNRVLRHHSVRTGRPFNTAASTLLESRDEWRHANASTHDPKPEFLTAFQAKELVNYLSRSRPRPGRDSARGTWQQLRNQAAVAVQLGAGLTPGEIRAMQLHGVTSEGGRQKGCPWKLTVPADGNTVEHETPIASWAGHILQHWLNIRTELAIPGVQLFPSTKTGKPWGKVAQYQSVQEVMDAAGLDKDLIAGGSFRLRHTFALRQLRRGHAPEEVARWMGLKDAAAMARYRQVIFAPITDVA